MVLTIFTLPRAAPEQGTNSGAHIASSQVADVISFSPTWLKVGHFIKHDALKEDKNTMLLLGTKFIEGPAHGTTFVTVTAGGNKYPNPSPKVAWTGVTFSHTVRSVRQCMHCMYANSSEATFGSSVRERERRKKGSNFT
jgi:hypothetical protein